MIRIGRVVLDLPRRRVVRSDGGEVDAEARVFDLLWYLAQRPRTICSKAELLDAVWGDRVVSESTLYRAIALARALLGKGGEARIRTVHGRGYELIGSVEPLPPEPLDPAPDRFGWRRWRAVAWAVAALAVLAATVHLAPRWLDGDEAPHERPRVLLDFGSFLSPEDSEFLPTDAFWDDLRIELSRVRSIRIGDDEQADMPRRMLEGHWRLQDAGIVAHAELVDLPSRRLVWSGNFRKPADDIDALRHELAGSVTRALKLDSVNAAGESLPLPPAGARSGYADYLKARSLWRERNGESLQRARTLLERVVTETPAFARAHEALASVYVVLPDWQDVDVDATRALAWASAREALRIEPRLGEARAVLAQEAMRRERWLEAESMFRAALNREPANATIRHWYAEFLLRVGHLDRAGTQAEEAMRIDAIDAMPLAVAAWAALLGGQNEVAIERARAAVQLGLPALAVVEAWAEARLGRPNRAANRIESLPNPVSSLLDCGAALRNRARRVVALERLAREERSDELAEIYVLACRAMLSPENVESPAIRIPAADSSAFALVWSEEFSGVRQSEEFGQHVAASRMIDYWRQTRPPAGCRLEAGSLVCGATTALALRSDP